MVTALASHPEPKPGSSGPEVEGGPGRAQPGAPAPRLHVVSGSTCPLRPRATQTGGAREGLAPLWRQGSQEAPGGSAAQSLLRTSSPPGPTGLSLVGGLQRSPQADYNPRRRLGALSPSPGSPGLADGLGLPPGRDSRAGHGVPPGSPSGSVSRCHLQVPGPGAGDQALLSTEFLIAKGEGASRDGVQSLPRAATPTPPPSLGGPSRYPVASGSALEHLVCPHVTQTGRDSQGLVLSLQVHLHSPSFDCPVFEALSV